MPEVQEVKNTNSSYIHVEQTLGIIKPDAIEKADEIEEIILKQGFSILQVCMQSLWPAIVIIKKFFFGHI